jgi:STE24 endopeptidase
VTRFLILIPFFAWMTWAANFRESHWTWQGASIFLAGYVALVLAMGIWSRVLARRVDSRRFRSRLHGFNWMMTVARTAVAAWFIVGLFGGFGWGEFVRAHLPAVMRWPLSAPGAFVATLPAYLAWMGLWWAQYPADRALREQGLLALLESDLPVHSPPSFRRFFGSNLRTGILVPVLPILLILVLRDFAFVICSKMGLFGHDSGSAEVFILLGSSALVYVFAPVLLTSILKTQPLPDSELRRKLETMCQRSGLKYRQILLWHTDNNTCNAAVMGLFPQVRYILLSDLLLESMSSEQVEAVFAHEMGHVVYLHMMWYTAIVVILALATSLAEVWVADRFRSEGLGVMSDLTSFVVFILVFGFLSRRFERQADVYAARTIQKQSPQSQDFVGAYGAGVFSSALKRVAVVNNMPLFMPREFRGTLKERALFMVEYAYGLYTNWLHGSLGARMAYVENLAEDSSRTDAFDRFMLAIYFLMIVALVLCGSAAWIYRDKLMS